MLGWLFGRKPTKESLHGHRRVAVCGMRFTIRKLNALADFDPQRVPMVFSDTTRHRLDASNPAIAQRIREDMEAVIQAGVVDPPISPPGKPGINAADLFRDPEMGYGLYAAIIEHSLLRFTGVRRPVFFLARLLFRLTQSRGGTGSVRRTSSMAGASA